MAIIRNYFQGVNNPYIPNHVERDELSRENFTSLNNFLRYGRYKDGHKHEHLKSKSISDVLCLTDPEIVVLINFIQICRLNKDLLMQDMTEEENDSDDLFFKLLASLQNSPVELPMFYNSLTLDEDIFYYNLIKSLYRWLAIYLQYCKDNGYKELYTLNIIDLSIFNGQLKSIQFKMNRYIINMKVILASTDRYTDDEDVEIVTTKKELKKIMEEILSNFEFEEEEEEVPPVEEPVDPKPEDQPVEDNTEGTTTEEVTEEPSKSINII